MKSKNRNGKLLIKLLVQSILFWGFALFSYAIFRFYGLENELDTLTPEQLQERPFGIPLFVATTLGLGLGLLYGLIDFIYEKYLLKRLRLGVGLLVNTLLHFTSTIFVFSLGIGFFSKIFPINFELQPGWWWFDKRFWAVMWYIILASLVFSILKIAAERFGPGVFFKMLMGHYKNPQEEERIFMFLDLKDSTTIAEKLEHHKYSQFIQDCFYDLNEVVLDYGAEIYQYVGDEAVLSWPYQKGLANNNCLGVFFAFEAQRLSRKEYYLSKYDVFPEFKAGIHGGPLMVAEVGFVKKELAYHGDVINTSARIQAECNKHDANLLISTKLLDELELDKSSKPTFLGSVLLKGKRKEIGISSIITNPISGNIDLL
ncbi:adenylate/guanylate cyclase domain-containing protein [Croceivirga thetidis]|uniref:Adenylate/guanylate cyclase domain-containing protein n=1 Tax=Croceivirga thetidis TaxID=2721623 RepID=A0ABX1GRU7_9FLAO|nr:adenylate/guanylate cyclase domain-containing protein [Croceivirga thetidis]NKI32358.1 adenylate/guanylate cyclase domain-containing protein [Croceivirga thetidis]